LVSRGSEPAVLIDGEIERLAAHVKVRP